MIGLKMPRNHIFALIGNSTAGYFVGEAVESGLYRKCQFLVQNQKLLKAVCF